jgi:ABC-2 type transport system permease protein
MVLTIARKEFLEMTRDGRFRWAAGAVFVLLVASLLTGWRDYAQARRQTETAQREERERWLNQGEKYEHSAAHYGVFVFKPPTPLTALDQGINAYAGASVFLEAHKQNLSNYRPAADGLGLRRFGELSAAVTLQLLIPLLIVLLTLPAFVGEREAGTLRQLLSAGVSRRDIAFGKAIGLTGPLLLLLVPAAIIGSLAVALSSGALAAQNGTSRLGLMALCYLLYFAICAGVSLTVSARASTSRQALALLLAFWFVNALVAPQVVAEFARAVHPPPTGLEFDSLIREKKRELAATTGQRRAELERRLLQEYGAYEVKDLPVNVNGLMMLKDEEAQDTLQDEIFDRLYKVYERQDRIYQAASALVPGLGVQSLSMGLAGTDFAHHRHFARAAEGYRQWMMNVLNESIASTDTAKLREFAGTGIRISQARREVWERVPPFSYTAPSLELVTENCCLSIAALLTWFVFLAVITPAAVSRAKIL